MKYLNLLKIIFTAICKCIKIRKTLLYKKIMFF